jgi:hypothetical protein
MTSSPFSWLLAALPATALVAVTVTVAPSLPGQVSVLTRHYDNARTGANLHETALTAANVNKDHFGKLATRVVDGNIYAQPLIVAQARIAGRPGPANLAIVATEHNSVYAFDADDVNPASTTARLWQTGPAVLGQHVESSELYAAIGASECTDLTTEIGITSTPAIKITRDEAPREGVIFVTAKSKSGSHYQYRLFALSLADGARIGSVPIEGEVDGSGVGSTGSGEDASIRFDAQLQLNRPALLLTGNVLYVAFGGHCDQGKYHGWVFAYDVSDPKTPKRIAIFCTTPNGTGFRSEGRAGIWMSGQGPSSADSGDDAGSVYFVTGDGTYNGSTDLGDSVVKVTLADGKLEVQDWFTPENQELLKNKDVDLGSTGAVLIPNSHLLIAAGKDGRLFLIDRDKMGKGKEAALQSFQVTHQPDTRPDPPIFYNLHGVVIWARAKEIFVYVSGEEDPVKQYKLIPDNGRGGAGWRFESFLPFRSSLDCPTKPNCVTSPYPNFPNGLFGKADRDSVWMPGGFMAVSANGEADGSGILWVTMPYGVNANKAVVRGVLRAFDASDVSRPELWNSESTGRERDKLGRFAKFSPPVVANGKVYVATFQRETVGSDGVHTKAQGGDPAALVIYGLH